MTHQDNDSKSIEQGASAVQPSENLQERLVDLESQLEALREREVRARALFLEAPVAAVLLTRDGRVESCNPLAQAVLPTSAEAGGQRTFASLLAPSAQAEFAAVLRQAQAGGPRQSLEAQLPQRAGEVLEVRLDVAALRHGGRVLQIQVVITDLTAYKRAHQTLLNHQETFAQEQQLSAAKLRSMNEELDHVVRSTLQELSGPLDQIMAATNALRGALEAGPEDAQAPLSAIEHSSQQQFSIIQSVERYMQARRIRVRLRRVALEAVLGNVLKTVEPLLVGRRVRITSDPLPTVQGDAQGLEIILGEYLSNALKFTRTREEARLHVQVRETELEYLIGVEDNGVGFNNRNKERLFRLFQRQHSSEDFEGSGLGLASVRRVAERFGARTWGDGKVGQGATFWLAWPKRPAVQESSPL